MCMKSQSNQFEILTFIYEGLLGLIEHVHILISVQEENKWKGSFLHLVFGVLLNAKVDHIYSLIKERSLGKERATLKETAAVVPVSFFPVKKKNNWTVKTVTEKSKCSRDSLRHLFEVFLKHFIPKPPARFSLLGGPSAGDHMPRTKLKMCRITLFTPWPPLPPLLGCMYSVSSRLRKKSISPAKKPFNLSLNSLKLKKKKKGQNL